MTSTKLSLLTTAFGCLFFLETTTAQTCNGNLLQNPGFESGLSNWEGGGAIAADAHSGTKALTVCTNDQAVRQTLAAVPGTNYTFSMWAKNGGSGMQTLARIKFLNSSWTPILEEFIFVAGTNYVSFTASKTAPANAAFIEISVIKSGSGTGCAFADDLCLTVGGGGNPCSPDVTPPALSNCPADITINTLNGLAQLAWIAPTATDNCSTPTVTVYPQYQQGATIGQNTVLTFTATDQAGNTATCNYSVTVAKINPPLTNVCEKDLGAAAKALCAEKLADGNLSVLIETAAGVLETKTVSPAGALVSSAITSPLVTYPYSIQAGEIVGPSTDIPLSAAITNGFSNFFNVVKAADGNFFISANIVTTNGGGNPVVAAHILKVSPTGNLINSQLIDAAQYGLHIRGLAATANGGADIYYQYVYQGGGSSNEPFFIGRINLANTTVEKTNFTNGGTASFVLRKLPCGPEIYSVEHMGNNIIFSSSSVYLKTQLLQDYSGANSVKVLQKQHGEVHTGNSQFPYANYLALNAKTADGGSFRIDQSQYQQNFTAPDTFYIRRLNADFSPAWQKKVLLTFQPEQVLDLPNQQCAVFGIKNGVLMSAIIDCNSSGGGTGADLEVSISADKTIAAQWTNVVYTFTAKNAGTATIASAKIQLGGCLNGQLMDFSAPFGLVYAGVPGAPTRGVYDFVLKQWTLTNLPAGQSGVLTVTLFTLTTAEQKVMATCIAQSPNDPDSQPTTTPSNMANCTPNQDDEAVWTINAGQMLQNGVGARANPDAGEIVDFQIFPNPAGESVFINLEKWQGKSASISMFNQLGIQVLEKNFEEISASPEPVALSGISNGQYFLKIGTPGERPFWRKLVVARIY